MDDHGALTRLHPEERAALLQDLAALMRETQRGPAPFPPPAPKPPLFEGREDAEAIAKLIERERAETLRQVEDRIRLANRDFLSREEIQEAIFDTFDDIGLATETKENRRATGDRIRRILRWEKSANIVLGTAVASGLASAFWAILKLIGFNPPTPGAH